MISLYDIAKFVHVASIVVWVGAGLFVQIAVTRTVRARDLSSTRAVFDLGAWAAQRVFMPAGIVALATGLWMTFDKWSFSEPFISAGLGIFVVSTLIGITQLGPRSETISEQLASATSLEPLAPALGRFVWISRIDMVLLLSIVFLMVVKP